MNNQVLQSFIANNYIVISVVLGMYFVLSIKSSIDFYRKQRMAISMTLIFVLSIADYIFAYLKDNMIQGVMLTIVGIVCFSLRPLIIATVVEITKPKNRLIFLPTLINFLIYILASLKGDLFCFTNDGELKIAGIGYAYIVVEFIYWVIFLFLLNMVFYKKNNINRLAIFFCIAVMMAATIIDIIYKVPNIFSNTYALVYLFYFLVIHVYVSKKVEEEKEMTLREQRVSLMLSQIQPHFLYNTLNTITALCRTNPKLAEETTIKFSRYLRDNMYSMGESDKHPFLQELEHTNIYLDIEKLRFGDRVRVEYDIKTDDFELPMLTLQPIVENAVKHGICKKLEGGTIKISTEKKGRDHIISISDDGVGFDLEKAINDGKQHIGIQNVRERLKTMINAEIEITSLVGLGTTVRIIIPAERKPIKQESGERREILSIGR